MTLKLIRPLNKGQGHSFWYQSIIRIRLPKFLYAVNSNVCSMTHRLTTIHSVYRRQRDTVEYGRLKTRKPCCRKETARCRKCSFPLKFANNIHYKYKTTQASKAATLQSSKHADAKTQFNTKSGFKVNRSHVFGVSGKTVRQQVIIMLGLVVKVSTFDDNRHSIYKKDLHIFPWISTYSADHNLILRFPLVTCTEETVYSK